MNLRRQRGVALLVAIIMFAIATTVAAAITYNKAMAARRAAATFTLEQALQAGMAAEALAQIVLENDAKNSRTELNNEWAQPVGPLEIEGTGIWIQAQLEDLSGRFNLNSLVRLNQQTNLWEEDPRQTDVFIEILTSLNIDQKYAYLLVDWLDSNILPHANGGGEDTLYLTQAPPYRPPNTPIVHTSELLALPQFGAENYQKLAPLVTALPLDVLFNTCTATGVVLDMMANEKQQAYQNMNLAQLRQKECFPPSQQFLQDIQDTNLRNAAQPYVGNQSSWFRLRTNIRIGTAEFVLYSVLVREGNKRVRTYQRSFGSE